jgi:hypothetical protein
MNDVSEVFVNCIVATMSGSDEKCNIAVQYLK